MDKELEPSKEIIKLEKSLEIPEMQTNAIVFQELIKVNSKLSDISVHLAVQDKDIDFIKHELVPIRNHNAIVCGVFVSFKYLAYILGFIWTVIEIAEFCIKHF